MNRWLCLAVQLMVSMVALGVPGSGFAKDMSPPVVLGRPQFGLLPYCANRAHIEEFLRIHEQHGTTKSSKVFGENACKFVRGFYLPLELVSSMWVNGRPTRIVTVFVATNSGVYETVFTFTNRRIAGVADI